MRPSLQFASLLRHAGIQRPGLRLVWALVLCTSAASSSLLHAQSTAPTPDQPQPAPATLPAAATATDSSAAPAFRGLDSGLGSATSGFGQNQAQIPAWSRGDGANFRPGSHATQGPSKDPFQLAPSFGSLAGPVGGGMGFNGAAGGFGSGRQGGAAMNPFGSAGIGGRQGNPAPLFPTSDGPTRDIGGPFGTAPVALPSLNQVLRGSYNLPLNSSSSSFKLSYQDIFKPGASLSDLDRPSASAMFSTSDLGNGMFLSAGTTYSSHSMAGAPAASLGNESGAGTKHSGPSVALKLSF